MKNALGDARSRDAIDRRQLDRLAHTVLDRPATELSSIARHNPALVSEWIAEIRNLRDEVDAEKRALETALERLQDLSGEAERRRA